MSSGLIVVASILIRLLLSYLRLIEWGIRRGQPAKSHQTQEHPVAEKLKQVWQEANFPETVFRQSGCRASRELSL